MISGFIRAFLLFVIGIPVTIAGVFMVPLALPFRKVDASSARPYTQYPGEWVRISLPQWARYWDNPADGAGGDTRGWWNNYCWLYYDKPATAFWSMFQWLAIRNPANYWSRVTTGVDESRCIVSMVAAGANWKLWRAVRDDGKVFPLFEGFIPYGNGKGLEWRIGWKIDFDHVTADMPEDERYRGSVFRIRPWKSA